MVKKLKKQYETPQEGWNEERINREVELMEEYGLKNKKEVFKAQSQLRSLRREARKLVSSEDEKQRKELIERAHSLGLIKQDSRLEDILSLNVTDILDRRLQTAVNRRGHSDTVKQARQLVTHGHVYIDGERVTIPGYLLTQEEEKQFEIIMPEPSEDGEETVEEEAEEVEEQEESDESEEVEAEEETDEEDQASEEDSGEEDENETEGDEE